MTQKIRLGVLYGGQSPEHQISLLSAQNVLKALDNDRYDIYAIGIAKDGRWYLQSNQQQAHITTATDHWVFPCAQQTLEYVATDTPGITLDVIFPLLHGPNGEDGSVQGLLKLANFPYVGATVAASAIAMDKDITKRLLKEAKIPTARSQCLTREDLQSITLKDIMFQLGTTCFVKPANMGSSIGVSKVYNETQLQQAIDLAFEYDNKILIEAYINGREIECAVLGNHQPRASLPGEIIPKDYYSYQSKYVDVDDAQLITPADLDENLVTKVQQLAIQVYKTLGCCGMARVDFFITSDNTIYVNEVNTIPGFTHISQYPSMWAASGLNYTALLDELIRLALERYDSEQSLQTNYHQTTGVV